MKDLETNHLIVNKTPCDVINNAKFNTFQGHKENEPNYNNILTTDPQLCKSNNITNKSLIESQSNENRYKLQFCSRERPQMNHTNGTYKRIDTDCSVLVNHKSSLDDVNDDKTSVSKCDVYSYKTWPERCDKNKENNDVKSVESVNIHVNNGYEIVGNFSGPVKADEKVEGCLDMSRNEGCAQGTMRLNQALDNISLAYNPITKQLHFVSPKSRVTSPTSVSESDSKKGSFSDEGISLSNGDRSETNSNESPRGTLVRLGHQRSADGGSFSSTVSSLSECSLSDPKDTTFASAEAESRDCTPKADPVKVKKKGLSGFFSRGVFPWRSNAAPTTHTDCKPQPLPTALPASPSPSPWRLFGNQPAPASPPSAPPEQPQSLETPASSGASTPQRKQQHARHGSNVSAQEVKQFEDLVASSIALIQHNRPAFLPAKDTAEEHRHRQEYQRMVEAARRREAREARERRRALARQARHEDELSSALKEWNTSILPTWEAMKSTRKTRDLWWCGLPPAVRGKVWQLAIPNHLNVTPQLYHICVDRAKQRLIEVQARRNDLKIEKQDKTRNGSPKNAVQNQQEDVQSSKHKRLNPEGAIKDENSIDDVDSCLKQQDELSARLGDRTKDFSMMRNYSEQNLTRHSQEFGRLKKASQSDPDLCEYSNERSMELIQLDIARTFPNLCIFQPGGPYFDVLHELLAAYVCYRPDVGYVQGMSFLAAILILNMDAPEAFVCFANLLNGPVLRAAFTLDGTTVQALWSVHSHLLEANLPLLHGHFRQAALGPELYLLEWLYSGFAKAMPLDVACRVWDVFLRDGDEFLFRTALGVLHLYQDELIKMDFITASQFLTKLPEELSGDALFKSIGCINMMVDKLSFLQLVDKFKDNGGATLDDDCPAKP